jgi:predicted Ser/Thr protein kinase
MELMKKGSIDFLQNYDDRMIYIEGTVQLQMKKYEHWSKVLIEPTSLNVARLYAIETRINEEENNRIKETKMIQESFRNLIYTLE